MSTGRKFWLSLVAMALCVYRPEAASAVAAIALAFNGANATVEWAHAKTTTVTATKKVKP